MIEGEYIDRQIVFLFRHVSEQIPKMMLARLQLLATRRIFLSAILFCLLSSRVAVVAAAAVELDLSKLPPAAKTKIDFVKDIQPIFQQSCLGCHGPKKQEAELRWDVKEIALKGGEHGAVIVPGKSAGSKMIQLVAGLDPENVMPKKGERLTAEQVGLLRAWIDQGANWPANASVKLVDNRNHWSFKTPVRPAIPLVKNKNWVRNPIDNFVLAKLEKENLGGVAPASGGFESTSTPGAKTSGKNLENSHPPKAGATRVTDSHPPEAGATHLAPSPEADRVTLIRRLSLDLIGLPPTIAEIDAFVADKSPAAYDKVLERLLASPHYGERWGRHWLDAARYADSNGYEKDLPRVIWPYRDWVIDAFNRDLPFDEFAIEQLAGDLLPNATTDQKVATGFLRNSMLNEEGGIDPEEFRIQSIIDRVDTVGKSFLGLTINCAQCHNHKYDPISQKEYYQVFAFLNNDDEPTVEVPNTAQKKQRAEILAAIAKMEDELAAKPGVAEEMASWENEMRDLPRAWTVLDPEKFYGAVGTKFEKLHDKSLLAGGSSPPVSGYTVTAKTKLKGITGFRLETITDPNLPDKGPGRADNGNFVLTEFSVVAAPENDLAKTNAVELQNATADFSQTGFPVSAAIDKTISSEEKKKGLKGDKLPGWANDGGPGRRNKDRNAVFETKEPLGFEDGTTLMFTLTQTFGGRHTIGRFRISATTGEQPLRADPLSPHLRDVLAMTPENRSPEQQRELFSAFRIANTNFADANKKIAETMDKWPDAVTSLVLQNRWTDPRATHIFKRGDFHKPGDLVSPNVPSVLPPLANAEVTNRLSFARWIADKKNPLTPRVIVNRIWQEYFGRGLVVTAEDFGTQGERPSHPELLDWLASEFVEPSRSRGDETLTKNSGSDQRLLTSSPTAWSMKHIHRLIAQSATYRQSSVITPESFERDQYNRELARGPRVRVEAEVIRDIALSASGLLTTNIGGPSVYPPIPDGVLGLGYGAPMKWETETNENRFRRGMYIFWKRTVPYPSLSIFDQPNADFSCPRRLRSNTPLQALTTLNDPVFVEAAQAMALRVAKEGGKSDREKAEYAFRLCVGREPSEKEINRALALLNDQENYFDDKTTTAISVAARDEKNPPAEVNLHKVAAWTMVSRVLLNLDETITKE